jgi:hypothetical protein
VVTPLFQACVIYFLRKRGLASQFPYFYAFNILQCTTDVFLLCVVRLSYRVYFYSYWVAIAATVGLTFALVDELFRLAFRNYDALRDVGSKVFRWVLLLVFLGAFAMAFTFPGMRSSVGFADSILIADRCARIMLCLWAVILVVGSSYMRISRRSMLFGIALGIVFFAFTRVLIDSVALSHFGSAMLANRFNSCMYLTSCVLWLAYAAYGEGLPVQQLPPGGSYYAESSLEEENRPLMELINDTVDRYLRNPS